MNISNVEIKTASNGNTYKQVTLSEKAFGKDRTNVFSNHPLYGQLEAGFDIPLDQLEINQKGYLELKGGGAKQGKSTAGGFTDADRHLLKQAQSEAYAGRLAIQELARALRDSGVLKNSDGSPMPDFSAKAPDEDMGEFSPF